ncbi:hypothetical protein D3C72_1461890 [compost metagenome]
MNNGGNIEAAAVMFISVFINSCTLSEPNVGISISGITIKNCSQAARVGTPCLFNRMVFSPKMPLGISVKKILTGAAVHISNEPNIAVKETSPTKRFISTAGRPKCADRPSNTCTVPPVKCKSARLTNTLSSKDATEYSTPITSPEMTITLTKERLPPLTSLTYTATDSAPPAA